VNYLLDFKELLSTPLTYLGESDSEDVSAPKTGSEIQTSSTAISTNFASSLVPYTTRTFTGVDIEAPNQPSLVIEGMHGIASRYREEEERVGNK